MTARMSGRGSTARAVVAGCAVATTLAGLTLGATSATARFHEVPETGFPGYLVLRSDPRTDLDTLRDPIAVVCGGIVL